MIKHYLKVAFRNLVKYKTQSLVSIIGLAVGFTCFALSVLWIRYEMTYDTFHNGADRIYMVRAHYTDSPGRTSNVTLTLCKLFTGENAGDRSYCFHFHISGYEIPYGR